MRSFFQSLSRAFKGLSFISAGYNGGQAISAQGLTSGLITSRYDPKRAYSNSVIAIALGWIASNCVEPPLGFYQRTKTGKYELIDIPKWQPLLDSPTALIAPVAVDEQSIDEIIQGLFVSLVVDGNAYLRLWRSESDKLVGFSYVPHWEVDCDRDTQTGEVKSWRYVARNGNQVTLQPDEILHVKYGGPDPNNRFQAMSAVKAVTTDLELDPRARRYLNALFKAPWASGIITPGSDETSWSADETKAIKAKLREEVSGESAGAAIILSRKASYEKLGLSPADMDVSTISENVEARIAAATGVSPMILQLPIGLKHSTYSNYQEAKKATTENVLAPLWKVLGRVFTKLYREMGLSDRIICQFNLKEVLALQEDASDLHDRVREDFKANIIDQETALIESGRTPSNGSRGVYFWQLQPVRGATPPETTKQIRKALEDAI